jgi:hypothetical protein
MMSKDAPQTVTAATPVQSLREYHRKPALGADAHSLNGYKTASVRLAGRRDKREITGDTGI